MRAFRTALAGYGVRPLARFVHTRAAQAGPLLAILRRNSELSEQDAANELRWMNQALDEEPSLLRQRSRDDTIAHMVRRRSLGEPLQYILESTDFGPLTIRTRAPVLIPRLETAYITELLAQSLQTHSKGAKRPLRVLDLCSGSGCIALLLKYRIGSAIDIRGGDISPHAISLSRENATALNLDVRFERVDIWRGADIASLGRVDVVVSNPPYIPRAEWDQLDKGVKEFEDPGALVGDPDHLPHVGRLDEGTTYAPEAGRPLHGRGLAFYRRIAEILPTLLTSHAELEDAGWTGIPRIAVEVGHNQAGEVSDIFMGQTQGAVAKAKAWNDQYDVQRMVVGWS